MTLIYSRNGFHANRCRNSTCFDYKYVIQQNKHMTMIKQYLLCFYYQSKLNGTSKIQNKIIKERAIDVT